MTLTAPTPTNQYSHFGEVEVTYGDITATPAAGDAVRLRTKNLSFKPVITRLNRDQDADRSASRVLPAPGRISATFEIMAALASSGVTGTPTPPDLGEHLRAHFGVQRLHLAHSTCTTGSTTTSVVGSAGATAALGAATGDFLGFVTTAGIEARQITVSGDTFTVTPALTSAPINGSAIYGCAIYKLSKAAILSMILYGYLDGDFKHLCAGCAMAALAIDYDMGGDTPEPLIKLAGPGARVETLATAIPTPTLAATRGLGSVPMYAWIDGTKVCVTKAGLKSDNGLVLVQNQSCGPSSGANLYPTGLVRTGNNGKWKVEMELEMLNVGATVEALFDNARALANHDVTMQLGTAIGNMVAWRVPNWVPAPDESDVESIAAISLKGECYQGAAEDSELTLAVF
jgi:hypothetical protein